MHTSPLKALEEENAALRRELAALRAPTNDSLAPTLASNAWGDATLETLFEALPDYIFVVERGTMRITFCNDVFARAIGFAERHHVERRTIYECFPPAQAAHFAAQNEMVFRTGQVLHEIERINLPDGAHHFDTYKIPLRDGQGRIIGLIGTSRDITDLASTRQALAQLNDELEERVAARTVQLLTANQQLENEVAARRAAEAEIREQTVRLAESEARFRLISERMRDVIFHYRLGPTPGLDYVSPSVQTLLGYTPQQYYADPLFFEQTFHPDDLPLIQALLTDLDRVPDSLMLRWITANKRERWVEFLVTVVRGAAGEPVAIQGVARDVTERTEAFAALQASEERFRTLSICSPVGIFLADTAGLCTYANPRLQQIFGLDAAAMLGAGFTRTIHPDDVAWVFESWMNSVRLGREHHDEYRLRLEDGTLRWVRGHVAPMRVEDGTVIGYVGTIEDISEQKRVDAALVQSQKLEGLGRLAGGVAHDFNNLLLVIAGCTDLVQAALPPNHFLQADLAEIQRAAERATKLTRQLLTFARRQPADLQVLNLNTLLRDMGTLLRRLIRTNVELVLHLEPVLWPVLADAGQIEQVIINLAVNAYDAMPRGGTLSIETMNVVLDADYCRTHLEVTEGPYVLLSVADNGTGMSSEVQALAFEPFFTTKEVGKGTGLGLATIYGIVKQHRGSISLASEPGIGTTIKIYLPRTRRAAPIEQDADTSASDQAARGAETVLLVEDDPSVRALAARVLRSHGYNVVEASDGAMALDLAVGMTRIDLLLTDMIMPGMSGTALAQQLSERYAIRRVLFMSGYSPMFLNAHSAGSAEDSLLQKPFLPDALAHKVRAVLDAT